MKMMMMMEEEGGGGENNKKGTQCEKGEESILKQT